MNWAERLRTGMHGLAESLGNLLMEAFHYLALFAIGAITAWAGVMTFIGMLEKGHITVDDILLLFIYLELAAMVGIYFKTNHMPIRFMIYVAITALTRLLIRRSWPTFSSRVMRPTRSAMKADLSSTEGAAASRLGRIKAEARAKWCRYFIESGIRDANHCLNGRHDTPSPRAAPRVGAKKLKHHSKAFQQLRPQTFTNLRIFFFASGFACRQA